MITLNDIKQARETIAPYVKRTPLERSDTLSRRLGTNVYIKYELFQKTGSFKPRGAFNTILSLTDEQKQKGVVAVSGGNHAQGVAYAATNLGVESLILMPANTPQNYLDAARGYGATVELLPNIAEAFAAIETYTNSGMTFVHPFDDERVIAGQGTVGLEILEDCPQVTDVFASIGGGGMAVGVAIAIKESSPPSKRGEAVASADGVVSGRHAFDERRVFGVETHGADAMAQALAAGQPVTLPAITSIAKTLGAPAVTERTLKLTQDYIESVTVVTDAEALAELKYIAERLKVICEPASSCTLAAAEKLRDKFSPESHVVIILCGGNFSLGTL
ncbi:MAG: threonine/serine dehydratase [bacterium]|nr:threonine/serine dehydratase [bacterium]